MAGFYRVNAVFVKGAGLGTAFAGGAVLGVRNVVFYSAAVGQTGIACILYIAMADILLRTGIHHY